MADELKAVENDAPNDLTEIDDQGANVSNDLPVEDATGHGSLDEGDRDMEDLSESISDTGWDTDLELEDEKVVYDTTGRRLYLETCETLGVIPASYFLRTIQAEESHINLCHHGVGPKGTKAIAVALTNNTAVTHLDLSDNGLATEGAIAITTMMKENCYITHLDLSDNNMGPPGAFALAPLVSVNSTIVHLSLRGNGFNDKSAEPMAELIRGSFHIKFLDLSHNEFGEVGGVILGPALIECEVLQTLDLSWNHIRRKGAAALADGIKNNQSLRCVNLSYNGLDNQGAVALADTLKVNSTLEQLDISNNRICTDGAIVLSKVLPLNDTLKELKIGHNPLQSAGVIAFLDALKVCTSKTLQVLSFEGITITLAIDKSLKELLGLESHQHLSIPHGGTGGYKHPKPKQEPIEKLDNYCQENNVVLVDLFKSFDKESKKYLPEEQFRAALKHISAPLMEFERQKLIAGFVTSPPPPEPTEEGVPDEKPPQEGESPSVFVDYMLMVETAKQLKKIQTTQK